jgi:glycosyltransferase involved in cell wall biosynthesis
LLIKILFICNEYPPFPYGGIGTFVQNMCRGLLENQFECTVVGIYPIKEAQDEMVEGVRVIRLKENQNRLLRQHKILRQIQILLNKWKLTRFVKDFEKKNKPDLIESYEWNGPLLHRPSTKLIVRLHGSNTAHSEYVNNRINSILKFYENLNIKLATRVVSVSHHMLDITEKSFGIIKKSKEIIYNSYNESLFKKDDQVVRDPKQLLFVGKFHERKGVIELFKILNEILVIDSSFHFLFVGAHTEDNAQFLLELVNPDIRNKIRFLNAVPQSELPRIYNESSLMIMPSRAEAFGLTTIEAMACGCVVAMSNLPVALEIIDDKVDGILIDVYNIKESANHILSVLNDLSILDSMSKCAMIKAEGKFSASHILHQNIDFYKRSVYDY